MMKTFKQISIGDAIFRLCDNYDLGRPDKTQVHKIVITSLSKDENTGNLLINQVNVYSGGNYWSIVVKADKLNKSYYKFDPEQNTHRKGLYFINESDANYIVKRAVIAKIKSIENSIPETVKRMQNEIKGLRSTFNEILNPSFYPDYKII